jgi:hypothetical protein
VMSLSHHCRDDFTDGKGAPEVSLVGRKCGIENPPPDSAAQISRF